MCKNNSFYFTINWFTWFLNRRANPEEAKGMSMIDLENKGKTTPSTETALEEADKPEVDH